MSRHEHSSQTTTESRATSSVRREYHARPIGHDESLCAAVVRTVAEYEDVHPCDLEPLYRSIDPDPIERLVESGSLSVLSFEYAGFLVEIRGGSRVVLAEP